MILPYDANLGRMEFSERTGKRGFVSLSEPKELVDALLDELLFSLDQRAAIERQAVLHAAK